MFYFTRPPKINEINIDENVQEQKEAASNIIENISGDKLNENSIKAVVEEISKKNISKHL